MRKLKPCPFCGYKNNVVWGNKSFWVTCEGCGIETQIFETKEDAEQMWNRRVDDGKE